MIKFNTIKTLLTFIKDCSNSHQDKCNYRVRSVRIIFRKETKKIQLFSRKIRNFLINLIIFQFSSEMLGTREEDRQGGQESFHKIFIKIVKLLNLSNSNFSRSNVIFSWR